MADKKIYNKFVRGDTGEVLLSIDDATLDRSDEMVAGVCAHNRFGQKIVGNIGNYNGEFLGNADNSPNANGKPISVNTWQEMDEKLKDPKNLGNIYLYTGETQGNYINNELYIVVEETILY